MTSASSLKHFVNEQFYYTAIDRHKLVAESHPLLLNELNRIVKDASAGYSFLGLEVNELYAYSKNDTGFALYILLGLDLEKIKLLVKLLGNPENIESPDLLDTGEFPFLTWQVGALKIWLQNDSVSNKKNIVRNKSIITITNMNYSDLINMEKM